VPADAKPTVSTRRLYFPEVNLRFPVVALLAILLQLIAIFFDLGSDLPHRILFLTSYVLLIGFVIANWRRPGIVILGAGLLLNFIVIAANGGLMPTTPEVYAKFSWPEHMVIGHHVPGSKDIVLERPDIHLWFLGDRFRWDVQTAVRVFSIGDVIIVVGLIVTLAELLLPRLGEKPSRTR
jgi:hypothetical protein